MILLPLLLFLTHQTLLHPGHSSVSTPSDTPSHPPSSLGIPAPAPIPSTSRLPTHPMQTKAKNGIIVPKHQFTLLAHSSPLTEPNSFKEAMTFPEWQKAMSEEYSALIQQGTWSLVPLPPNAPVIGCKWIYRIKKNSDGSVARYKARLVAQGFQQTEGVDYTETFSPVAKQQTIRLVLSLALHHGWSVKQLDVSNAFLHGTIQEQVYLKQPQGYVNQQFPSHVCKLHKALYGLKQAPRAWYDMLSKSLLQQGFYNSKADSSLFILVQGADLVYVLVYVDDILITGSDPSLVDHIIKGLGSKFALKDLGLLHYFLDIEVVPVPEGLVLSQAKYALDLLKKAGMTDCRPCASPSSLKPYRNIPDFPFSNPEFYRTLWGLSNI